MIIPNISKFDRDYTGLSAAGMNAVALSPPIHLRVSLALSADYRHGLHNSSTTP